MAVYIVLGGLLVAILTVTKLLGKQPTAGLRHAQVILLAVAGAILCLHGLRSCGSPPAFTSAIDVFERAAGHRLGMLIASEAAGKGSVLVVQWRETRDRVKDNAEAQLEGLRDGLGDSGIDLVVHGPAFPEGDDGLMQLILQGAPVTGKELRQWVEEAGNVVAIVSFIEVSALLNPKELKELPPVYVKSGSMNARVEALVKRGFLRAVVVDKPDINVSQQPPRGSTVDELFDLRFQMLTSADSTRAAVTRFRPDLVQLQDAYVTVGGNVNPQDRYDP